VEDYILAHAKQIAALFTIGLALVDPLDGERIAKRLNRFIEGDAVVAPVLGRLVDMARSLFRGDRPAPLFAIRVVRNIASFALYTPADSEFANGPLVGTGRCRWLWDFARAAVPKGQVGQPDQLPRQKRHFNLTERVCCRLAVDSPVSNLPYNS
jgi:hypothetical protein